MINKMSLGKEEEEGEEDCQRDNDGTVVQQTATTKSTTPTTIPYESHYLFEKQACRECGSKNVYTRVYAAPDLKSARWLCRNCAEEDYVPNRGYKLLSANVVPSSG